jgi:hypothetical protein
MEYIRWLWHQGGRPLLFALMFNREVQMAVGGTLLIHSARFRAAFAEFLFGQKGSRFRGKHPGLIRRSVDMKINLARDAGKALDRQWKVSDAAKRLIRFLNTTTGKKPLGWAAAAIIAGPVMLASQQQMAEDQAPDPIAAIPLEPGENPMPVSMSRPGLGVM